MTWSFDGKYIGNGYSQIVIVNLFFFSLSLLVDKGSGQSKDDQASTMHVWGDSLLNKCFCFHYGALR